MKRFQLFEFGDQAWLSGWMREGYLDCLSFIHRFYQPYYGLLPTIRQWAEHEKASAILDIGSGSAEHIAVLLEAYKKSRLTPPHFILSDLYPDIHTYEKLEKKYGKEVITYIEHPLSALNIQGTDVRHWSIFTTFHHFSPTDAHQLLQQLSLKGDGLCILELTQRSVFQAFLMLSGLPVHLLVPFFSRTFGMKKMLFTTIIPIIPLMVAFDGVVSVLRSYTQDEIYNLMPPDSHQTFNFEYKEVRWRYMPLCKATAVFLTRKR